MPKYNLSNALFVGFAVLIASLNALQARVNGELGFRTGDGIFSAMLSIGGGFVILSTAMLLSPKGRQGIRNLPVALRDKRLVWWQLLGGLSGAYYAIAQTTTGLVLGVALFSVALVSGQTLSSILMDRFGVGPSGMHPITWPRLLGTVLVLFAVTISVTGQLEADFSVFIAVVPFLAGFAAGWQMAVNGRVKKESGSVLAATFLNFSIAISFLVMFVLIKGLFTGWPASLPQEPWLYTGGILGAIFIAGSAFVVGRIGVLVLGVSVVAGQLVGAMIIDIIAPSPLHPLTSATLLGVVLALVAVAITSIRTSEKPS
jgi:transporter family-2 protein